MAYNRLRSPDETDLLLRFQNGDQLAFDVLFKKFYQALCFFSTRMVADRYAAEEIVQDILFKLWNKHTDFNKLEEIKAFLYISTRNASLNHLDKEQRKIRRYLTVQSLTEEVEEPVLNDIIYTEVLREISTEMNNLPEQCGKIIRMIFEDDMKPQEIADKLCITVSTVYNQKMRGLSILKKRLSNRGYSVLITMLITAYLKQ